MIDLIDIIGKPVIIRTFSAGVHFGTLKSYDGRRVVVLSDARRIWYWEGAFTLSAVAMTGVNSSSKLSVVVPEILLTEVIEIIPCSEEATQNLRSIKAHGH